MSNNNVVFPEGVRETQRHGLEHAATGQAHSGKGKSKQRQGSFYFQAADYSEHYFEFMLESGNRSHRRKAKKMLRRKRKANA